jgi:hypothetical protein
MVVSIVNHSNGQVTDEELQKVIRAINRQSVEYFAPYWSMTATLRLKGAAPTCPRRPSPPTCGEMR